MDRPKLEIVELDSQAWRDAALMFGEFLSTVGPKGYYNFTPQQWVAWAKAELTKSEDDPMGKGYKTIGTSAEVWAVLKARHGAALRVYGSYSAPQGDHMGDPTQAVMMTEYGFEDGQWPLMGARTTWELTEKPGERKNEQTAYWLCYRTESQHEEDA